MKYLLLLLLTAYASAQVIGIDLGTEFWKACLILGKTITMVENPIGERKGSSSVNISSFRFLC